MKRALRLLFVDDQEDSIILIREALADKGAEPAPQCLRDGVEALQYLRREPPFSSAVRPDIVMLDINMPRKDGFEVLREMKLEAELRAIPVIILSASDRAEDIELSYAMGASAYITKPSRYEEIRTLAEDFSRYWTRAVKL